MFYKKHHFINIHTHQKPLTTSEFAIRNAYTNLSVLQIGQLPYSISVGLHPWYIYKMSIDDCVQKITEIGNHKNVLAIGEIGIDRSITTPITKQLAYFEAQLHLAEKLNKPVIIHTVRSYSDLIPFLKKSSVPFIFHQFSGNPQQAKELLKYNCMLSFGINLFTIKTAGILKTIPTDSFFLETDIAPAKTCTIEDIYLKAAEIRTLNIDELKEQLFNTFVRVFGENKAPEYLHEQRD